MKRTIGNKLNDYKHLKPLKKIVCAKNESKAPGSRQKMAEKS